MVKTVIFDMGNVLIRFDPQVFLDRLDLSGDEKRLLFRQVFRSVEWLQMDRGILALDDAMANMRSRLPENLHWAVDALVNHWHEPLLPVEGMEALILHLKQQGYRILLLSNAPAQQSDYWDRIPGSQYFDGTYRSCDHVLMKPEPAIYDDFLKWFGLKGEECVFIDDSPANIEAAILCGIPGTVFDGDMEALQKNLRSMGVAC